MNRMESKFSLKLWNPINFHNVMNQKSDNFAENRIVEDIPVTYVDVRFLPIKRKFISGVSNKSNYFEESGFLKNGIVPMTSSTLLKSFKPMKSFAQTRSYLDLSTEQTLTHLDKDGKANMVDVGDKQRTERTAKAKATVIVGKEVGDLIRQNLIKKGDVLSVAKLAGIMGAKKTSELIPLCHNINLSQVTIDVELSSDSESIEIISTAKCEGKTGVEMEAITGAAVAAIAVYDMCKAINKGMVVKGVCLLEKTGGARGDYSRSKNTFRRQNTPPPQNEKRDIRDLEIEKDTTYEEQQSELFKRARNKLSKTILNLFKTMNLIVMESITQNRSNLDSSTEQTPTRVDRNGCANMIDIGGKQRTERTAKAKATVIVGKDVGDLIRQNLMKKGDVLSVAKLAGKMGAKKTSELIPYCDHNINLSLVAIDVELSSDSKSIEIISTAKCEGKTGVEMEAITGAAVAAITVYDMCKAINKGMVVESLYLLKKTGGVREELKIEKDTYMEKEPGLLERARNRLSKSYTTLKRYCTMAVFMIIVIRIYDYCTTEKEGSLINAYFKPLLRSLIKYVM